MSDTTTWEHNNETYLAAALAWLRLRLQQHAQRVAPEPPAPPLALETPAPSENTRRLFRFGAAAPQTQVIALPAPGQTVISDDEVAAAAQAMHDAAAVDPAPALVLLAQRFGLTRFEQELLLLCVAMELDPRIPALCGRAQGDARISYPTFALALSMFDDPTWEPLSPERPLRYFSLSEIYQPPATQLISSALRADERVVSYLKGVTYLDDRLAPLLVSLDTHSGDGALPASHARLVEQIVREIEQTPPTARLPAIQLLGSDAPSKQMLAWHVAAALGLHLYRLPSEILPTQAAELERLARLWQRESLLVPIGLYLDAGDVERQEQALAISRFVTRSSGIVVLDTRAQLPTYGRPSLVLEVARPTADEQQEAWHAALGPDANAMPARMTAQFDLGVPTIQQIVHAAAAASDQCPLDERVWTACLIESRKGLDGLAQRIEPKATWDDIVLPPSELRLLRQIADQVGHRKEVYETWGFADKTSRGLGINALFAGPSGTGKTMAAEVIANHLRLNLYRIDLSAVVSKYIGETEKNLARLFDAAESGGVVLFFDEADALFGKRTEIRDSHDRYANIEINYLLQRMEAYRGLAILATNMKSALDVAFVRRLRFIVNFPYPGVAERKAIWQKVFPAAARPAALDFERLAKLNFTGGNVFTIAMNAAFLAAQERTTVAMPHVLAAARNEARKLDQSINERDFQLPEEKVTT